MHEELSTEGTGVTKRRRFLGQMTAAVAMVPRLRAAEGVAAVPGPAAVSPGSGFGIETAALLQDWGEGLLRQQVVAAGDQASHGAFRCPACGCFHGRAGDAFLPFLALAARSGEERWRAAALAVLGWMRNVESDDGAWTNETDPASWKGITVFSAIALAEALEWHGGLLEEGLRATLRARLKRAGGFIRANFRPNYSNINYMAAGAYALVLLGRLLDEPGFRARGRELARGMLGFFTPRDRLLFGEGKPNDRRSPRGCVAVDLGYNVEESLPSLVHYALHEGDREVLETVVASWRSHLEFLMPDGGWDNSWGTRMFKWTWWGSRTSDGCQAGLVRLAGRDPVFGEAAWRNLRLLRACTRDGLLHGGPHLAGRGVPPCVHHTFCHAKALAGALHHLGEQGELAAGGALPREQARGVRGFHEISVVLAARGPWRATVSGNDWPYKPGVGHASGGALGVLWHQRLGLLACASMPRYVMAEAHNMQPHPDAEDFALTPRVEVREGGGWFSNLHDPAATIAHDERDGVLELSVETRLVDEAGTDPAAGPLRFRLVYRFDDNSLRFSARPLAETAARWALVFPLVSPGGEKVTRVAPQRVEVAKPGGKVVVEANVPLDLAPAKRERVFHLVPGFEALPWVMAGQGAGEVRCELRVEENG